MKAEYLEIEKIEQMSLIYESKPSGTFTAESNPCTFFQFVYSSHVIFLRLARERLAPERLVPERLALERLASERSALERSTPEKLAPER